MLLNDRFFELTPMPTYDQVPHLNDLDIINALKHGDMSFGNLRAKLEETKEFSNEALRKKVIRLIGKKLVTVNSMLELGAKEDTVILSLNIQ